MKKVLLKHIKSRSSLKVLILVMVSFSLFGFISLNIYTPTSYINSVDNGSDSYIQEKAFGEISLKLKHMPAAYFACQEILDSDSGTSKYSELKNEYHSTSNYLLRIEALKSPNLVRGLVNDQQEYQAFIEYLSFGIKNDLELQVGEQSIACSFSHFERNFDTAPVIQIQIGFQLDEEILEKLNTDSDWSIKFNAENFNLGPLYFFFEDSKINDKPFII